MALQRQLVSVPITGGVDEKSGYLVSQKPLVMRNCVERKTGELSKRYGYTAIGRYNARLGGGSPPAIETLATRGDELVRIGAGDLDTFHSGTASDWLYKCKTPEAAISGVNYATAGAATGYLSDSDICVVNGKRVIAYVTYIAASASWGIVVEVHDIVTGAVLMQPTLLQSIATGVQNPRVVASGTTFGVFWYAVAAASIRGQFFDSVTLTSTTAVTDVVTGGVFSIGFDVSVKTPTRWCFAYLDVTGIFPNVKVIAIDTTFAVTIAAVTVAVNEPDTLQLSIAAVDGDRIWVAWGRRTGGTYYVKVGTLSTNFGASASATLFSAVGSDILNVGIAWLTTGRAVVAWTLRDTGVQWTDVYQAVVGGAFTWGAGAQLSDAYLLSRPIVLTSTRAYAFVSNTHGTHGTVFLVDLAAQATIPAGASARLVATAFPRQLQASRAPGPSGALDLNKRPRENCVSNAPLLSAGQYTIVVGVNPDDEGASSTQDVTQTIAAITAAFDNTWTRTSVEVAGTLVLSGGAPSAYDGRTSFEIGFAYEPDVDKCAALVPSALGGSLTGGATYGYRYVYAWTDALGNVHRSAPSKLLSVPLGGGDNRVSGTVPPLHLTNKYSGEAPGSRVEIEIYRTASTGSTLYYVMSVMNAINSAPIAFIDTASDAVITSRRALYTTGGELANTIPPSATVVATYRGSLLLAGTDDDSVYFSKPLAPYEGAAFNGALTQASFEGGRVTALADLYGSLVVTKADSVWRIGGEPPADNGTSSLTSPERVSLDSGCTDPRSVVQTPDGVMFLGRTGLVLLDRGYGASHVGKQIEDTLAPGIGASAALVPAQNLVRFPVSGTAKIATFDYYHARLRQQPQWSVDTIYDVVSDAATSVAAATMWRGAYVWVSTQGHLFQETTAAYYDADPLGDSAWVGMSFQTSVQTPQGPQSYARFWDVSILGSSSTPFDGSVVVTTDTGTQTATWPSEAADANKKLPVHCTYQNASWMTVSFTDAAPTTGAWGSGVAMSIRSIQFHLGVRGKLRPAAAASMK